MVGGSSALFLLAGNHDPREPMRRAFDFHACMPARAASATRSTICRSAWWRSTRWSRAGPTAARRGAARLARRAACRAAGKPTLVALHHPPFRTGIGHMDRSMLRDGDALAAVIGRHPQVERVICGHVHRPVQRRFAGTHGAGGAAVAHQAQLCWASAGPWICEPPAVLLHRWHGGRAGQPLSMIGGMARRPVRRSAHQLSAGRSRA